MTSVPTLSARRPATLLLRARLLALVFTALAVAVPAAHTSGVLSVASAAVADPTPVLSISNTSPRVGEAVTISNTGACEFGRCSDNLKWFPQPMSGSHLGTQIGTFAFPATGVGYSWSSPGNKTVVLTTTDGQSRLCCSGSTSVVITVLPPMPAPGIDASPSPLEFGSNSFLLGAAGVTRVLTVTSNGDAPLVLGGVSVGPAAADSAPGDYTVTANTCSGRTRPPGTSCTVTVRFRSTALLGARDAVLSIASNATPTPTQVPMTGTAAL